MSTKLFSPVVADLLLFFSYCKKSATGLMGASATTTTVGEKAVGDTIVSASLIYRAFKMNELLSPGFVTKHGAGQTHIAPLWLSTDKVR